MHNTPERRGTGVLRKRQSAGYPLGMSLLWTLLIVLLVVAIVVVVLRAIR
jgi:hypothetical protein